MARVPSAQFWFDQVHTLLVERLDIQDYMFRISGLALRFHLPNDRRMIPFERTSVENILWKKLELFINAKYRNTDKELILKLLKHSLTNQMHFVLKYKI